MRKKVVKDYKKDRGRRDRRTELALRVTMLVAGCSVIAASALIGNAIVHLQEDGKVYASDKSTEIVTADGITADRIPAGIKGVISGMNASPAPGSKVESFGTSADNIMVGQRIKTIDETAGDIDVSESLMSQAYRMNEESISKAASATLMSDADYSTLLRIVEAEAGDDDVKGRVLVANVILNRVARPDFPNTVTDVVFQYVNGVPQFAPVYDGAFYTVEVTDDTKEAVRQALSGTDYSEGALFFVMKDALEKEAVSWFDTDLVHLFKYGVHDFYTYPEDVSEELLKAHEQDVQQVQTMASAD